MKKTIAWLQAFPPFSPPQSSLFSLPFSLVFFVPPPLSPLSLSPFPFALATQARHAQASANQCVNIFTQRQFCCDSWSYHSLRYSVCGNKGCAWGKVRSSLAMYYILLATGNNTPLQPWKGNAIFLMQESKPLRKEHRGICGVFSFSY